jgi:threonine aldolase
MTESRRIWRGFASDNYAGVHPEILAAMVAVNDGHESAYGSDSITARLDALVQAHFGSHAWSFPVFNGTGANVVSLQACVKRWEAVICAETAHINCDEGGAPEKVAGLKLWTIPTKDGKLTPELIAKQLVFKGSVHHAQPAVVSITQTTELGTVYSVDEIKAIGAFCKQHGLYLHLDGARISNAAAALGVGFREFTTDAGVDIVSFGATKIGAMGAEAVIVLNPALEESIAYLRKTSMQLGSKMRFMSAQIIALIEGDLWKRNATHANVMAARLEAGLRELGFELPNPAQANAVFPIFTPEQTATLQKVYPFYVWDEFTGQVRLMCSWDTTVEDVDDFLSHARGIV